MWSHQFYTDPLSHAPLVLILFCAFAASLWAVMKLVIKLLYRVGSFSLLLHDIWAFGYSLNFLHCVFQRKLILTNKCVNCITTLCFWSHLQIVVSERSRLLRPSASSQQQVTHRWALWRHTGSGQGHVRVVWSLWRCWIVARKVGTLFARKRRPPQRDVHFWWVFLRLRSRAV